MSAVSHPLPQLESIGISPREQTIHAARRALYESSNRVLIIALSAVSIALLAVVAFTIGIYRESLQRQPLVVGVDQSTGSVMALRPEALSLNVNDVVLRSSLENFVRMHYERLPVISRRDYNRSLFAMSSNLTGTGSTVKDEWKAITDLDAAVNGGVTSQEIQVDVQNSTYSGTKDGCHPDAGSLPCVASVYFTKKYYTTGHAFDHSRSSIVVMNFFLRRMIKNDEIQTNPIGLLITDLHESEGQ